ncbi:MAG: hypothetical protein NT027_12620 [Proteobacteria bacterium]|nr:hypothetical protein [Pseudomonadota bacterium]
MLSTKKLSSLLMFGLLGLESTALLGADLDNISKPTESDVKPTPTVAPTIPPTNPPPTIAPTPVPTTKPEPKIDGYMQFGVRAISNMENGFHIMDDGYRAQCVDSQGVVSQAKMDIYASINGELGDQSNSQGYTAVTLRPSLEYLRSGATSGSCQFTVCLPQAGYEPGKAFQCDQTPKQARGLTFDPQRPIELKQVSVSYSVSGQDINIKTNSPMVSAFHPVFGFASPEKSFKDYQSPIVINLSEKSDLNLTDVWDSNKLIRFDLVADGYRVRSGWIGKNAGLLAMDFNKNGVIDNGLELFGEYTTGAEARPDGKRFENGFLALAQYDSNKDGAISAEDTKFADLVVWQDKNEDGISQKSEIKSLKNLQIKSLSLAYQSNLVAGKPQVIAGNEARLISSAEKSNGTILKVYDVWFKQRRSAERPVASK